MSFIFIGLLLIGGWLAATELVETKRKDIDITETRTLTETETSSRRYKKFGRDFLKICGNLKIISINGMEKQNEGWMDDLRMWNLGF